MHIKFHEMNASADIEKRLLEEVEFLPAELVSQLETYNIFTIGHLLGATRGLRNTALFGELHAPTDLISRLQELISEETLEIYRSYSKVFPTGLIKTSNHNEEKEKK